MDFKKKEKKWGRARVRKTVKIHWIYKEGRRGRGGRAHDVRVNIINPLPQGKGVCHKEFSASLASHSG